MRRGAPDTTVRCTRRGGTTDIVHAEPSALRRLPPWPRATDEDGAHSTDPHLEPPPVVADVHKHGGGGVAQLPAELVVNQKGRAACAAGLAR